MNSGFYKAFEDAHRGSRESILTRLRVYSPILEAIDLQHATPSALDIGCGRGEWLELLAEKGIEAEGVDIDPQMLQIPLKKGLNAKLQDGLQALRYKSSESLSLVTMFHLAEHLDFQVLMETCAEAYRALKTGGILLIETPNPENLTVGTSGFYSDPTHNKPLPQQLLTFLVGYCGFEQVETLRLNHPTNIDSESNLRLVNVLFHVSPDYAVLAVKQQMSSPSARELFNSTIENLSGIGLEMLSEKMSLQQSKYLQELEGRLHQDLETRIAEIFSAYFKQNQHESSVLNQRIETLECELAKLQNKTNDA